MLACPVVHDLALDVESGLPRWSQKIDLAVTLPGYFRS